MGYRTKLDYSSNRQISQREKTDTILSGSTIFGLPFSALTTGPNSIQSGITESHSSVFSTFSGNATTTIYTWFDPRMELAVGTLSAMTPLTSAFTQDTGNVFIGNNYNTIDGNISYSNYTGVSFTLDAYYITELGGGIYSGTVQHYDLYFLSATSIDYSGRTIWVDNPEITRTNRLIITDNPVSGYVWTCIDSEGMGEWQYNGSSSASTTWISGTGVNSAVLNGSGGIASGITSVSEGYQTSAVGDYSHSEGINTIASGTSSHAEGNNTIANGITSHAEGYGSTAAGDYSHAEGNYALATGNTSHAEGTYTIAGGTAAHAEGTTTKALGLSSHAEGNVTIASGDYGSHAEGMGSIASGITSHAEGNSTIAGGINSHAQGVGSIASGNNSHAEGQDTQASGNNSHAEGWLAKASGATSHAQGYNTTASGDYSHAQGYNTTASGITSHAEGVNTIAGGQDSHAQGTSTQALGYSAHAEGANTIASGQTAHAEGGNTIASGDYSHAEGQNSIASGATSHAQGYNTTASGDYSHAQGRSTVSSGDYSHAGGYESQAVGLYSFVHGYNSVADSQSTVVLGPNITGTSVGTVYVPNIIIDKQDGLYASILSINTSNPSYSIDARGNGNRLYYDNTSLGKLTLSATTGIPTIGVVTNTGVINQIGGITIGVRAWDDGIYTTYGKAGDAHVYSSKQANGLVLISSDGTGTEDYIECYVGGDATSGALAMHMHGTGATKGYVGFNTNLPTERLDVDGNGRFRSIGSSASSGALHYTADGTLTTNTSDERLKTNIISIASALDKVKQLRGVTYNWTENPTGDTRIGFIAQEVNSVVPELTFTNPNSQENYMGVHYDNVTALLVEAVKELSNELSSNNFLETQTILAEDNNIELNYNGTHESALDGGITIINGISENNNSFFKINSDGDFTTNVNLIPKGFVIPEYTPTSSSDSYGLIGNFTRDDNYLYIKGSDNGWKRINLENF